MDIIVGSSVSTIPIVAMLYYKEIIPNTEQLIIPTVLFFILTYCLVKWRITSLIGTNIVSIAIVGAITGLIYAFVIEMYLGINDKIFHLENVNFLYIYSAIGFSAIYSVIYLLLQNTF